MPPTNPKRLYDLAAEVLAEIEAIFAAASVTLPDVRYVANGSVAIDCEQLTVQVENVYRGIPSSEAAQDKGANQNLTGRAAALDILLIRCIPTLGDNGESPSATELQTSGEQLLTDAWVLFDGVTKARVAKKFLADCDDLFIGFVSSVEPQGGFGGTQMKLRAQV